jgi:hypothetical protein
MATQDPLFNELLSPIPGDELSISEILTCVSLEELRKLGFPLTEEDYRYHLEDAQRRRAVRQERLATRFRALRQAEELKLRSKAASKEAQLHRIALKAITPLVAAYRRGQDWRAVKRWLAGQNAEWRGGSLSDVEAWLDSLKIPDHLRGRIKRPPDLPSSEILLEQLRDFENRVQQAAKSSDRFGALMRLFPDVSAKSLRRFELGRFFIRRVAKGLLADYHRISVRTLERYLRKARSKTACPTNPSPARPA